MTSWYDWRMAFAWLMAVAVAGVIYFVPVTRLVDSLSAAPNDDFGLKVVEHTREHDVVFKMHS